MPLSNWLPLLLSALKAAPSSVKLTRHPSRVVSGMMMFSMVPSEEKYLPIRADIRGGMSPDTQIVLSSIPLMMTDDEFQIVNVNVMRDKCVSTQRKKKKVTRNKKFVLRDMNVRRNGYDAL